MNASEVRIIASNYDKDYCAMPEGVELWGIEGGGAWWLTGTTWFLLKGNSVISSQYQPPCESEKEAKRLRTKWINELMRAGEGL